MGKNNSRFFRAFLIQSVSLFLVYLIITLPTASATPLIHVFGGPAQDTVQLPDLVSRTVTIQPLGIADWTISLDVKNASSSSLDTWYLYTCTSLDPSSCISLSEDIYFGNQVADLVWSQISSGGKANILLIVNVNKADTSYQSYWHRFDKQPGSPPTHTSSDIPSIDVHTSGPQLSDVVNFIEDHAMIPFHLIDKVVFTGASVMHNLAGTPPTLSGFPLAGSEITLMSETYRLVLPDTGVVHNGITLHNAPPGFLCGGDYDGDGQVCDAGEDQQSCCYDCGCSAGFYCDASGTCTSSSAIALDVIEPTSTTVTNCNEINTITVTAQMKNLPSDASIVQRSYILDGDQTYSLNSEDCTEVVPGIDTCTLTVPPVIPCIEGSFILQPNSITFTIDYSDGPTTVTQSFSDSFDPITIGSWTCGDGACDNALGENSANCCYDCGCSAGLYCDFLPGSTESSAVCAIEPSLTVKDFTELFTFHDPTGNDVSLTLDMLSTPVSYTASPPTCSMSCLSGGEECSSSCSLVCTPSPTPGDYSAACTLTFAIAGYDALEGYSLTPTIDLPLTYQNGASTTSTTLQAFGSLISFGPHFCGDNTCDADETPSDCCYDCGCATGFCSTLTPSIGPSPSDACVSNDFQLVIDDITSTSFVDQTILHTFNITAHITNAPPNPVPGVINPTFDCTLGGGIYPCTLTGGTCTPLPATGSDYPFRCEVTLPALSSSSEVVIPITGNSLSATFSFYNTSFSEVATVQALFDDLSVTQVSHCGQGTCETFLGENTANCCLDCPCLPDPAFGPGYVCVPGGGDPMSSCTLNTSIDISLINVTPDPLECEILPPSGGGGCLFTESVAFTFQVVNPPSSLNLIDAHYQENAELQSCSTGKCFCFQSLDDSSVIQCSLLVDNIENPENFTGFSGITGGSESHSISFFFDMSYEDAGFTQTQDFSITTNYNIFKDNHQIQSCMEEEARLDGEIDNYQGKKAILFAILGAAWIFTLFSISRCATCVAAPFFVVQCTPFIPFFVNSCTEKAGSLTISSCLTAGLLFFYQDYEQSIQEAKAEKDALCAAPDTVDLGEVGAGNALVSVAQVGAGIACFYGLFGGFGGDVIPPTPEFAFVTPGGTIVPAVPPPAGAPGGPPLFTL